MAPGHDAERLKGNLDLLLLSVLSREPAHGYAVVSALREASDGAFDLPEGTVYPALHRLERLRWLSARWERGSETAGARRRKVYALTAAGHKALAAERAGWEEFTSGMGSVLRTAWGTT